MAEETWCIKGLIWPEANGANTSFVVFSQVSSFFPKFRRSTFVDFTSTLPLCELKHNRRGAFFMSHTTDLKDKIATPELLAEIKAGQGIKLRATCEQNLFVPTRYYPEF